MTFFGNFFKIDGRGDHGWNSVKSFLMNRATFDEHLPNFNFDRASAEQIYMIKNHLDELASL